MDQIKPISWSVTEAAQRANVPVFQVRAAIKRGELGHVRLGKHLRISDSALCAWVGHDASSQVTA